MYNTLHLLQFTLHRYMYNTLHLPMYYVGTYLPKIKQLTHFSTESMSH